MAGAGAAVPSAVPHSMQNLASGGFSVPQFGHAEASPAPHDMQKRARSGFAVPQLAQTPPTYRRLRTCLNGLV